MAGGSSAAPIVPALKARLSTHLLHTCHTKGVGPVTSCRVYHRLTGWGWCQPGAPGAVGAWGLRGHYLRAGRSQGGVTWGNPNMKVNMGDPYWGPSAMLGPLAWLLRVIKLRNTQWEVDGTWTAESGTEASSCRFGAKPLPAPALLPGPIFPVSI